MAPQFSFNLVSKVTCTTTTRHGKKSIYLMGSFKGASGMLYWHDGIQAAQANKPIKLVTWIESMCDPF